MDFNLLLADLRNAAQQYCQKISDKYAATVAYCEVACKTIDKLEGIEVYENKVIGLWIILGYIEEMYARLAGPVINHLCQKLFRHCARTVLNIQWQQLDEDSQSKTNFKNGLNSFHTKLSANNNTRFSLIIDLMETGWTHPTLGLVMAEEEDNEEEECLTYIKNEDPVILKIRVEIMIQENCEEFALNLCSWCLKHPALTNDLDIRQTQLMLLHKLNQQDRLQEECQKIPCHDGVRLISRLQQTGDNKSLCTELAQTFLIQDWIRPSDHCNSKDLLTLWIRHQYQADQDQEKFLSSVWAVAKLSRSTEQIGLIIDGLREECGDMFLQLYTDLCIFAINYDKSCLEKHMQEGDMEGLRSRQQAMASTSEKLSLLYSTRNPKTAMYAAVTAFALNPNQATLAAVKSFYVNQSLSLVKDRGKDCCSNCVNNAGHCDHVVGKINPATFFEVERLLNMLRPYYLNPDHDWLSLGPACEKYLAEREAVTQNFNNEDLLNQDSSSVSEGSIPDLEGSPQVINSQRTLLHQHLVRPVPSSVSGYSDQITQVSKHLKPFTAVTSGSANKTQQDATSSISGIEPTLQLSDAELGDKHTLIKHLLFSDLSMADMPDTNTINELLQQGNIDLMPEAFQEITIDNSGGVPGSSTDSQDIPVPIPGHMKHAVPVSAADPLFNSLNLPTTDTAAVQPSQGTAPHYPQPPQSALQLTPPSQGKVVNHAIKSVQPIQPSKPGVKLVPTPATVTSHSVKSGTSSAHQVAGQLNSKLISNSSHATANIPQKPSPPKGSVGSAVFRITSGLLRMPPQGSVGQSQDQTVLLPNQTQTMPVQQVVSFQGAPVSSQSVSEAQYYASLGQAVPQQVLNLIGTSGSASLPLQQPTQLTSNLLPQPIQMVPSSTIAQIAPSLAAQLSQPHMVDSQSNIVGHTVLAPSGQKQIKPQPTSKPQHLGKPQLAGLIPANRGQKVDVLKSTAEITANLQQMLKMGGKQTVTPQHAANNAVTYTSTSFPHVAKKSKTLTYPVVKKKSEIKANNAVPPNFNLQPLTVPAESDSNVPFVLKAALSKPKPKPKSKATIFTNTMMSSKLACNSTTLLGGTGDEKLTCVKPLLASGSTVCNPELLQFPKTASESPDVSKTASEDLVVKQSPSDPNYSIPDKPKKASKKLFNVFYQCKICQELVPTQEELRKHIQTVCRADEFAPFETNPELAEINKANKQSHLNPKLTIKSLEACKVFQCPVCKVYCVTDPEVLKHRTGCLKSKCRPRKKPDKPKPAETLGVASVCSSDSVSSSCESSVVSEIVLKEIVQTVEDNLSGTPRAVAQHSASSQSQSISSTATKPSPTVPKPASIAPKPADNQPSSKPAHAQTATPAATSTEEKPVDLASLDLTNTEDLKKFIEHFKQQEILKEKAQTTVPKKKSKKVEVPKAVVSVMSGVVDNVEAAAAHAPEPASTTQASTSATAKAAASIATDATATPQQPTDVAVGAAAASGAKPVSEAKLTPEAKSVSKSKTVSKAKPSSETKPASEAKPVKNKPKVNKPKKLPNPKFKELIRNGNSFFKCFLCKQTFCRKESLEGHWPECYERNGPIRKPKKLSEQIAENGLSITSVSTTASSITSTQVSSTVVSSTDVTASSMAQNNAVSIAITAATSVESANVSASDGAKPSVPSSKDGEPKTVSKVKTSPPKASSNKPKPPPTPVCEAELAKYEDAIESVIVSAGIYASESEANEQKGEETVGENQNPGNTNEALPTVVQENVVTEGVSPQNNTKPQTPVSEANKESPASTPGADGIVKKKKKKKKKPNPEEGENTPGPVPAVTEGAVKNSSPQKKKKPEEQNASPGKKSKKIASSDKGKPPDKPSPKKRSKPIPKKKHVNVKQMLKDRLECILSGKKDQCDVRSDGVSVPLSQRPKGRPKPQILSETKQVIIIVGLEWGCGCAPCGTLFRNHRNLIQHLVIKHLQPYSTKKAECTTCHLCQQSFPSFIAYLNHTPQHSEIILERMDALIEEKGDTVIADVEKSPEKEEADYVPFPDIQEALNDMLKIRQQQTHGEDALKLGTDPVGDVNLLSPSSDTAAGFQQVALPASMSLDSLHEFLPDPSKENVDELAAFARMINDPILNTDIGGISEQESLIADAPKETAIEPLSAVPTSTMNIIEPMLVENQPNQVAVDSVPQTSAHLPHPDKSIQSVSEVQVDKTEIPLQTIGTELQEIHTAVKDPMQIVPAVSDDKLEQSDTSILPESMKVSTVSATNDAFQSSAATENHPESTPSNATTRATEETNRVIPESEKGDVQNNSSLQADRPTKGIDNTESLALDPQKEIVQSSSTHVIQDTNEGDNVEKRVEREDTSEPTNKDTCQQENTSSSVNEAVPDCFDEQINLEEKNKEQSKLDMQEDTSGNTIQNSPSKIDNTESTVKPFVEMMANNATKSNEESQTVVNVKHLRSHPKKLETNEEKIQTVISADNKITESKRIQDSDEPSQDQEDNSDEIKEKSTELKAIVKHLRSHPRKSELVSLNKGSEKLITKPDVKDGETVTKGSSKNNSESKRPRRKTSVLGAKNDKEGSEGSSKRGIISSKRVAVKEENGAQFERGYKLRKTIPAKQFYRNSYKMKARMSRSSILDVLHSNRKLNVMRTRGRHTVGHPLQESKARIKKTAAGAHSAKFVTRSSARNIELESEKDEKCAQLPESPNKDQTVSMRTRATIKKNQYGLKSFDIRLNNMSAETVRRKSAEIARSSSPCATSDRRSSIEAEMKPDTPTPRRVSCGDKTEETQAKPNPTSPSFLDSFLSYLNTRKDDAPVKKKNQPKRRFKSEPVDTDPIYRPPQELRLEDTSKNFISAFTESLKQPRQIPETQTDDKSASEEQESQENGQTTNETFKVQVADQDKEMSETEREPTPTPTQADPAADAVDKEERSSQNTACELDQSESADKTSLEEVPTANDTSKPENEIEEDEVILVEQFTSRPSAMNSNSKAVNHEKENSTSCESQKINPAGQDRTVEVSVAGQSAEQPSGPSEETQPVPASESVSEDCSKEIKCANGENTVSLEANKDEKEGSKDTLNVDSDKNANNSSTANTDGAKTDPSTNLEEVDNDEKSKDDKLKGVKSLREQVKTEPFTWDVDDEEDQKLAERNERSLKALRQQVSIGPFTWDMEEDERGHVIAGIGQVQISPVASCTVTRNTRSGRRRTVKLSTDSRDSGGSVDSDKKEGSIECEATLTTVTWNVEVDDNAMDDPVLSDSLVVSSPDVNSADPSAVSEVVARAKVDGVNCIRVVPSNSFKRKQPDSDSADVAPKKVATAASEEDAAIEKPESVASAETDNNGEMVNSISNADTPKTIKKTVQKTPIKDLSAVKSSAGSVILTRKRAAAVGQPLSKKPRTTTTSLGSHMPAMVRRSAKPIKYSSKYRATRGNPPPRVQVIRVDPVLEGVSTRRTRHGSSERTVHTPVPLETMTPSSSKSTDHKWTINKRKNFAYQFSRARRDRKSH